MSGLALVTSVVAACGPQAAEGRVADSTTPSDENPAASVPSSEMQSSPDPDPTSEEQSFSEPDSRDEPQSSATSGDESGKLPEEQIETVDLPESYPEEITVQEGGEELEILGQEGGCSAMHAELTQQGPDQIVVDLVETAPADKTIACTADIRSPVLDVELTESLGERIVILQYEQRWE